MIRVVLPYHLRNLARIRGEVQLEIGAPVTIGSVLDAIESAHPALRGTIRDHVTQQRRPFIRFFACKEDLSNELPETVLPDAQTQMVLCLPKNARWRNQFQIARAENRSGIAESMRREAVEVVERGIGEIGETHLRVDAQCGRH